MKLSVEFAKPADDEQSHSSPGDLSPGDEDEKVIVIFEMPPSVYRGVKADFDGLISAHGLTCRVRFEDRP